jgi:hypothetical protein
MRNQVRVAIIASASLAVWSALTTAAGAYTESFCERTRLCADPGDGLVSDGSYVGHDEPALLFYSVQAGSGNSAFYFVRLPSEPTNPPSAGGVRSFRTYTAFWFGMAMCDSQSAPEFTHDECTPDSDVNIFNGSDPTQPDYAGHRPGGAYMELQFYPPATSTQNPLSCDAGKWCAALNIASFAADQTSIPQTFNNFDCEDSFGDEPTNFAWVTLSGNATSSNALVSSVSGSPAPTSDVLLMNPGDQLAVAMHDTPAGFAVSITDFSTGQQGTMIANAAHGFEQVQFDPTASSCATTPYTFHPMFATSSEQTRVWTAHTYNVAFSMEIGHQNQDGFTAAGDTSFQGPSYVHDWAGSLPPVTDPATDASSIEFPSPTFAPTGGHGSAQYDRIAFEADMPPIEEDSQSCDTKTGIDCTNPPSAAQFYPLYSNAHAGVVSCVWHFGDTMIPNTTNLFGGSAASEYGALLDTFFAGLGFRFENYRNVMATNPCPYVLTLPPNVRTIPLPIPPEQVIGERLIIEEMFTLIEASLPVPEAVRVAQVLRSFQHAAMLQRIFAGRGGSAGPG